MCGIIGYVGNRDVTPVLLEGLRRLEYRGYDSAGLAIPARKKAKRVRVAGRVRDLTEATARDLTAGAGNGTGIAHTRWATHGAVTETNCHPHTDTSSRIAIVHNGIIENADQIRAGLAARGIELVTETDTEVLAHRIAEELAVDGRTLEDATRIVLRRVEGTYGLVVMDAENPDQLVVARNGSPVLLGVGDGEMFVASDAGAIVHHTQQMVYLEDGEVAVIEPSGYRTSTLAAVPTQNEPVEIEEDTGDWDLDGYEDYMAQEIHAQPAAVRRALGGRLDERWSTARLGGINFEPRELRALRRVTFLGCGSAYYAGEAGSLMIEEIARIPSDAQPASEFRYRNPIVDPETLYVAVSQSGETSDTLFAVEELKRKGAQVIGVVNVVGSAIGRACGQGVFLHAGPEISVASTKALTNMTVTFAMLGVMLGRIRDLSPNDGRRLVEALAAIPEQIEQILEQEAEIKQIAERFSGADHMFFIGRVRGWPAAREGAQKLKEVSYIHAEAYPGSELKHGPLALIDSEMPSVVIIPDDEHVSKNVSTVEQIQARGGPVIVVTNAELPESLNPDAIMRVPKTEPELNSILMTVPLQLFAYHCSKILGRDIDKPRNLAKSVTVE
ncbi:MAG TPA: glutamine--fructose-6-phosphate transaminase (isomerizing) [Baekduia sp.]|nr:glutamine--fructose-6-phosphate transaminase (isomerizing) [Baekduia sp.]